MEEIERLFTYKPRSRFLEAILSNFDSQKPSWDMAKIDDIWGDKTFSRHGRLEGQVT